MNIRPHDDAARPHDNAMRTTLYTDTLYTTSRCHPALRNDDTTTPNDGGMRPHVVTLWPHSSHARLVQTVHVDSNSILTCPRYSTDNTRVLILLQRCASGYLLLSSSSASCSNNAFAIRFRRETSWTLVRVKIPDDGAATECKDGRSGFNPRPGHSGFSHVEMAPDYDTRTAGFHRDHSFSPPLLLHTHLASPTSALKTSTLRAAKNFSSYSSRPVCDALDRQEMDQLQNSGENTPVLPNRIRLTYIQETYAIPPAKAIAVNLSVLSEGHLPKSSVAGISVANKITKCRKNLMSPSPLKLNKSSPHFAERILGVKYSEDFPFHAKTLAHRLPQRMCFSNESCRLTLGCLLRQPCCSLLGTVSGAEKNVSYNRKPVGGGGGGLQKKKYTDTSNLNLKTLQLPVDGSSGFIGDIPFPPPFHSGAAPYSPSSTLKTSLLRATKFSQLYQFQHTPRVLAKALPHPHPHTVTPQQKGDLCFPCCRDTSGRPRSVRTVRLEEAIRQHINNMTSISTRSIARQMGVSHSTVWDVLRINLHYPYHWQKVHVIQRKK
ncbi:hypothetical protein PR048_023811 [Dryococelus australis]|uniref:Transposase IS204/IS1001/IS1096/IS1165 helix-turn-helix domain-containing protein n=1 Tax=Dryococelus australis TaxID=614101 RepID=A0ABQ9GVA6_9NEOP|nr:hypothetical protein PR048_023811 [Dryococelus australis]